MHLIELNNYRKVNISYTSIQTLIVSKYKVIECKIPATVNFINEDRRFIVEFMLPANACYYALLGAKFISKVNIQTLNLEIRYSDTLSEKYSNTIAYSQKTVYKGLSKEYVEIILNTSIEYFKYNKIPSGLVVFDTAACCEVGSSPKMFMIATLTVLDILFNEFFPINDNEIKEICEKNLLERN